MKKVKSVKSTRFDTVGTQKESILSVLRQYMRDAFTLSGVTSRRAFVICLLFNVIGFFIVAAVSLSIALHAPSLRWVVYAPDIFAAVLVIPNISLLVRRIRDTDNSLWWMAAYLIPLVGIFMVLTVSLLPSRSRASVHT